MHLPFQPIPKLCLDKIHSFKRGAKKKPLSLHVSSSSCISLSITGSCFYQIPNKFLLNIFKVYCVSPVASGILPILKNLAEINTTICILASHLELGLLFKLFILCFFKHRINSCFLLIVFKNDIVASCKQGSQFS